MFLFISHNHLIYFLFYFFILLIIVLIIRALFLIFDILHYYRFKHCKRLMVFNYHIFYFILFHIIIFIFHIL